MRMIDADAYAAELWKMRQNYQMLDDTHTADKIMHGLYRAEQALKDAPTISAVPVVHGEWKHIQKSYVCVCTACNKYWIADGDQYDYNYCPNCGAKMDGKRKEQDDAES